MAFKSFSLLKSKLSPVLTVETQTSSFFSGISSTLSNWFGQLTSPSTPTLDSLLQSLLSGNSLDSTSLSNLISQFTGSNSGSLNISSLINQLTQANGGSFDLGSISNLIGGLIGGDSADLDFEAIIAS